jgi:hypothetical protein
MSASCGRNRLASGTARSPAFHPYVLKRPVHGRYVRGPVPARTAALRWLPLPKIISCVVQRGSGDTQQICDRESERQGVIGQTWLREEGASLYGAHPPQFTAELLHSLASERHM